MAKMVFTYFLFLVFTMFIAMPTVVSFVNESYDISSFYNNINEEENHKNEVVKKVELKLLEQSLYQNVLFVKGHAENVSFYQNTYTSLSLDLQYPPPELS
ncbi:hypothetical protein [Formosa sp. A9]|uniref:hypothetical protein n=1 Tax=Formosa sp. A9 TaxID=3442641 RepID=UPI003EBE1D40